MAGGGGAERRARVAAGTGDGDAVDEHFADLGEHRLKDLIRPERLYQLGAGEFPPLRSLNRTNLPLAANPIVGRVSEQAELTALLRERRLVTITGTGGTGKTRLALQIAAELLEEFADGTFFVPLAGLTDPDLVVPAVTQALGLRASVDVVEDDEEIAATVNGEDLGLLIGKHGTTIETHMNRAPRPVSIQNIG